VNQRVSVDHFKRTRRFDQGRDRSAESLAGGEQQCGAKAFAAGEHAPANCVMHFFRSVRGGGKKVIEFEFDQCDGILKQRSLDHGF